MLTRYLFMGVAMLLMWTSGVLASGAYSPEYDEAIRLGVEEFDERNYAEARAHFARAHALHPNARTSRALGMAEFELKNYGECIEYLQRALASTETPLEGQLRQDTEALLNRARGYVARLNLSLEPGAAAVVVDGVPVQMGSSGVLVLNVGNHVLEFRAAGRVGEKRQLMVKGGESETLRIVLPPLDGHDTRPRSKPPLYKNPWLWTAVGVVVVGAATGTAVALGGGTTTRTETPYAGNGGAATLSAP